jgi:hypothetical protein
MMKTCSFIRQRTNNKRDALELSEQARLHLPSGPRSIHLSCELCTNGCTPAVTATS